MNMLREPAPVRAAGTGWHPFVRAAGEAAHGRADGPVLEHPSDRRWGRRVTERRGMRARGGSDLRQEAHRRDTKSDNGSAMPH